jgi:hypothetical protein
LGLLGLLGLFGLLGLLGLLVGVFFAEDRDFFVGVLFVDESLVLVLALVVDFFAMSMESNLDIVGLL